MTGTNAFEILLVEDDPQDADLTVRAMKKHNLANKLHVVEDGAEALDFIYCRGKYLANGMFAPNPRLFSLISNFPK